MDEQMRWHEGDIIANGLRQHYYRNGNVGSPERRRTLLLLHGFSEYGLCWSRVGRALATAYDVILLDARGHGRTADPGEMGYSQALLTQDVLAFMAALDLRQPVVFGYSNGALTAAEVAANAPERVAAVIVEDPPWGEVPSQPARAPRATAQAVTGAGEPWRGYAAWYASWLAWHQALHSQTPAERVASSQQFLPPGALNWPEEELLSHLEAQALFNLAIFDYLPPIPPNAKTPWRTTVERITCPVLLLTADAERSSSISAQEVAQIMAAWRNTHTSEYIAFPKTSHFLHHELREEAFDHFIAVIEAFLARLP